MLHKMGIWTIMIVFLGSILCCLKVNASLLDSGVKLLDQETMKKKTGKTVFWGECVPEPCDGTGWKTDLTECQAKGGTFSGKYGKFVFANNSSWKCESKGTILCVCNLSTTYVLCYINYIYNDPNCTDVAYVLPTYSPDDCWNDE